MTTYQSQLATLTLPEFGLPSVEPAIPAKVLRAKTLGGGKASFVQTARGIELSVPSAGRSDMDTIIALELDTPASTIKPVPYAGTQGK